LETISGLNCLESALQTRINFSAKLKEPERVGGRYAILLAFI